MMYKQKTISYKFEPKEKAAMIMLLDQFEESLTSIHEIKEMIRVNGSVVLPSHYAVVLAMVIKPNYPAWSYKLLAPLEKSPAMDADEWHGKFWQIADRVSG